MTRETITIGTGLSRSVHQVIHNLDEFGLDIHKAVAGWIPRRHNLTVEMFCRYIRQRDLKFVCLPLTEALSISNHLNSHI